MEMSSDSEGLWCRFNNTNEKFTCICGVPPEVGPYDAYTYLTIAPICILFSCSIIFTYFKMPQFRPREGNLILFISFSDIILGFHWFANGINSIYTFFEEPFTSDGAFCKANGFFSTIGGTGTLIYNISFVMYIACGLRYKLTTNKIKTFYFHILSILVIIVTVWMGYDQNNIGQSLWGTCSISFKNSFGPMAFFSSLCVVIPYTALVFFVIFYAGKELPKANPVVEPIRNKFLQFYSSYLTFSLLIWTSILALYSLAVFYSSQSLEKYCDPNTTFAALFGMIKFVNSIKMLSIFALTLLRLTDPTLAKIIFHSRRKLAQEEAEEPTFVTISQQMQYTLQVAYTNAILSNISMVYIKSQHCCSQLVLEVPSDRRLTKEDFTVKNKISIKNMPLEGRPTDQDEYTKGLNVHIIEYAPDAFCQLRQADQLSFDFTTSLDVQKNMERIKKAAKSDGGASGEFFFFTSDDRLIIKSMTERELTKILKMLESYYEHFRKNPESMIAKIYGIYSIVGDSKSVQFNLLLMRNTISLPREYILRTYDMKGSTVSREVLKKGETDEEYIRKRTLKDIDFMKLEKSIDIDPEKAKRVFAAFENDVEFFCNHNIMDYSILLVKIDKKSYYKRNPDYQDPSLNSWSLMSIPSVSEEGIYYHIAIIDYLQEYNFEKRMEKLAKKAKSCKKNLNISSTNPKKYKARILPFFQKILNLKDESILKNTGESSLFGNLRETNDSQRTDELIQ